MKSLIIDDDVVEHRSLDGAIHQQLLGAEHLRNLRQQHAAADRRHAIGDAAEQRVGADAAEPVRPAALVAEHEVRRAALRAPIAAHSLDELRDRARSLLELVDHVLRVEERYAIAVDRARRGASTRRADCSRSRGRGSARRRHWDGAAAQRARAACSLNRRRADCSRTDARTRARRRSVRRTSRPPVSRCARRRG